MLNNSMIQKINQLSQFVVNISSCFCFNRFLAVNTSDTFEQKAKDLNQKSDFLAGIIFNLSSSMKTAQKHHSKDRLPSHVKYTIRTNALYSMKTDILKNPVWRSHPRQLPGNGITYNYIFAPIQDMIDRAIISVHTGMQIFEPEVQVQAMPYPCHTRDLFLNHIGFFFPLVMMLTWIISVASMVRKLVYEKEICLEEFMKMMGVHEATNFLAWLLENTGIITINSVVIVLILKLCGILVHSNGIIIFLFLLNFGISVIMFSFLISVFFDKANTAALCGSIVYMMNFLPYIILLVLQKQFSFAIQCFMCLLSTTAFGQGIFLITTFESEGTGIQWNNLCQTEDEAMPFLWICVMIHIDSIMYFALGWYIGNILPAPVGQKKPWNFPFTLTYWKQIFGAQCEQSANVDINFEKNPHEEDREGSFHKKEDTFLPSKGCGVSFISVSKIYSNNLIAVKDLSVNFYKNEITSILGSNGAGKTTILSMLASLYSPTSGKIIVNGRDMKSELVSIRKEMGVCPQYDVLFDYLTVKEHLMFFGALKLSSWNKNKLEREAEQALQEVGLLKHQKKYTFSLSGGMKRRLSVATAFFGGAATVVLDEPTSGVDPCSRRYIWDVLLKHRKDCTMIFTTHNMDEADYLSDKICIIQHGRLKCYGSPSSLKEKYVQGYELTLTKEVILQLLKDDEHTMTQQAVLDMNLQDYKSENKHSKYVEKNKKTNSRIQLYLSQISASLIYSFYYTRRDWKGSLANMALPILFVTLAMGMFNLKPFSFDHPPLKLSSDLYGNEHALFFSTDSNDSNSFTEVIARHFGTHNTSCIYTSMNISCLQSVKKNHKMELCRHFSSNESCPVSDVSVPLLRHGKTCTLYNLSGFSSEELLLTLVIKDSYGGWSFTRKAHSTGRNKTQAKVWYSQKGFHTLPAYLNYLNNIILWKNLPADANWKQYGITVFSNPYQGTMMDEDKILENVRQCGVALCITLGFSVLTASIGSGIVKDYKSGAKFLQHISGLDAKIYWISHFIYNMAFYLVATSFCVCVIASFQLAAFTFRENLAASALLLILFGYATLPWMYLGAGFFPSPDVAFISYISINCMLGLCTMLLTFLPRLLAEFSNIETLTEIHNILKWVFLIFPQFCLGNGLMELTLRQVKFDLLNSFGIDSYISPFHMDFLGWTFTAMVIQGSIFFFLRLVLNEQLFKRQRHESQLDYSSDDMDVKMERERVLGGMTSHDILLLYNLRKSYQNNIVVKDICLGIKAGECFGLLGVNGSGKSTLFKMIIGEINPTCGKAMIKTSKGKEVSIESAYNEDITIGYCPQNDALDNLLTGREHLDFYCKLHGITYEDTHKVSSVLSHRLDFDDHIDKLVGTYSRGTKRKLLMAIALIGKPQILLLDEPTSGMDAWSKRHLWEAIKTEVHDGCAVVFTSHSMEECEYLCTRLAIMVNGNFKCIGPLQHIKNRFGHGYSLTLWLNEDFDCAHSVMACFKFHFPGVYLKDHHLNILECHIPNQHGFLDTLVQVLESMKAQLQIKKYSITQTSLDQVFIQFAAQQEEHQSYDETFGGQS